MKRFIFLFSLLLVFLTGCSTRSTSEIFYTISSTLPSNITLREDSETEYAMLNQSQTAFGGISLTDLSPSDINKGSSKMTLYYDTVLPGCQIGGWRGGRFLHRIWYNTLSVADSESSSEKEYYSVLFIHNSHVYDMWFDLSKIEFDQAKSICSIIKNL